jgi:flagellar motor switch protein FliM
MSETTRETMIGEATTGPVERVVTEVQAEESGAVVIQQGGRKGRFRKDDIQRCDFRQPVLLSANEMRKLRVRHEDFLRALAARLSVYLRLEVGLKAVKLETQSFQKYTAGLPTPAHVILFKVEPLKGVCLLDMSPKLGLTLVDRLLGGPAQGVNAAGELSEIDLALLDQVAQLVLNEWCQLWQKWESLRPVVLGHESNSRFLNSSPQDSAVLILGIEVRVGDCTEPMQLAFPFATVEPLLRQAARDGQTGPSAPPAKPGRPQWNTLLDEVPVRITTECHGLELSARALASLKPGDVVALDPEFLSHVEVRLEERPKFNARLGTSGDRWAAELTGVLKS